jgi:GTP cyclohydrolase I
MEEIIAQLLVAIGEDLDRPGLEKTPQRVADMWQELTSGSRCDPIPILSDATFPADTRGLVVCKDIDFVSLCEHHLLPFMGRATIAYLPGDTLVGISKLARITECFARRLQVQERLGQQILDAMVSALAPRGAMVHLEATHLCMVARGVRLPNARMVTTHVSGAFEREPNWVHLALRGNA